MVSKRSTGKKERWYYDACALDHKSAYAEIINKKTPIEAVVSHLSLGEFYAGRYHKGKEETEWFVGHMEKLRGYLSVVSNEGIGKSLEKVRGEFSELDIADAVHLATALEYGCKQFKTADGDFNFESQRVKQFALDNFSIKDFKISKVKVRR